ncbi:MAG: NADH-quinone oxidoreductase subunit J [Armatimonadetes bacterium]|nr:NADH-quinone oxidoreductase subunit J [Armatimonadota bacterium]
MNVANLGFFLVAGLSIVSAGFVIFHPNPVRSALFLVVNFICLAILYLTLNAQLLAALQVIVYAGAIMVLFLFVIMLLNLGGERAREDALAGQKFAGGFLALVVLGALSVGLYQVVSAKETRPVTDAWRLEQMRFQAPPGKEGEVQIAQIGSELFRNYLYPFELTSVLLLVGLIGAVLLAKRRLPEQSQPEGQRRDRP